jgi:hypothetical protein
MISQCRIGLSEVSREQITSPRHVLGRAPFLASRELEQRPAEVPSGSRALARAECITIGAKTRIQLAFRDPEAARRNGRVARESAAKRGRYGRSRSIIERVSLGGQQAESTFCIAELPPGVVDIATRALRCQPLYVLVRRLREEDCDVSARTGAKCTPCPPFPQHQK